MAYAVEGGQWEQVKSCMYVLYMDINIYNLIYKLFTAFPFSVLNIMETMQALSLVSCNSLIRYYLLHTLQ
jgi:hypothetical protein